MAKGNKCSGCLQKLKGIQNRLAQRKDWEAKAKKAEQEIIADWESKINSTPSQCICGDFEPPIHALGGTEYNCDKCKQHNYLQHNEYDDCPPHVCEQKKCSQCNNTFIEPKCPTCEADQDRKDKEWEKKELELQISALQQSLKSIKWIPKDHPSYNEYQIQQLEKQLAEAIKNYKSKYGELPSSLRDDSVGGGVKTPPRMERVMCCG